jgi:hypothetical protein
LQEVLEEGIILFYNFTGAIKNCTFFYFKFKQGCLLAAAIQNLTYLKIVSLFFYLTLWLKIISWKLNAEKLRIVI